MTDLAWLWIGFNLFVLLMLALDLGVFHRKAHAVTMRESLAWTTVWVVLALLFNAGIAYYSGREKAVEFLTGYLIEKSLSVDNVFVFALLFAYFRVPAHLQHKVLFWGIIGALVMRAGMIVGGAILIEKFSWIIYVFGLFLLVTGYKMMSGTDQSFDPANAWFVRLFRRVMPVTHDYQEDRFTVRIDGKLWATPLLLVLVSVEITDLIFAVDSIPAIFAVTSDPFIVYTSNVFAILGLRSLYFVLGGMMEKFVYLKIGLGIILMFVGVKMLLAHSPYKIPSLVALGVVALVLIASIAASFWKNERSRTLAGSLDGSVVTKRKPVK